MARLSARDERIGQGVSPVPGADVAVAGSVPVQMREGRTCRRVLRPSITICGSHGRAREGPCGRARACVRAGGRAHSCQQHLPRPLFHSRTYHGTAEDVELAEIPVMPQIGSAAPITPFVPYGRTPQGSLNAYVLPKHVPELPVCLPLFLNMPPLFPTHALAQRNV